MPTNLDRIYSEPIATADSLIVAGTNVWVLDAQTGGVRWTRDLSPWYVGEGAPVVAGGLLVVAPHDVVALSLADGAVAWARTDFVASGAYVSFDGVAVYVGVADETTGDVAVLDRGRVVALDALTGRTLWEARPNGRPTSPAIAGGQVIAVDSSDTLYAWDVATGAPLWQTPLHSGAPSRCWVGHAITDGRQVAVPLSTCELALVDVDGRNPRWLGAIQGTPTKMAYGLVFAQGEDGNLAAWETTTGQRWWTSQVRGWPTAVFDGKVLVGNYDGAVLLVSAETGDEVMRLPGGGFMSAIVSCGNIFGAVRPPPSYEPAVVKIGMPGSARCAASVVY